MTKRELGTVLAALRWWQLTLGEAPIWIDEIATDSGEFEPLSVAEIDDLCERLNTSGD